MASLFRKFQEAVQTLAKNPMFARDPRQMQFEADVNRLFLFTSYKRLGRNADKADAEEIIDMASKASAADQQKKVQENIHTQVKSFCLAMDEILLPDTKITDEIQSNVSSRASGLGFAVGKINPSTPTKSPDVPVTRPFKRNELSQKYKDLSGYTLDVKPSQIPHKEAGQGLFINGEADVGTVLAFYPGVIYSPAHYPYIPGYPRVDMQNPYLITRYDGTVINAQPWGTGGETRGIWDGLSVPQITLNKQDNVKGSDRLWRILSKPLASSRLGNNNDVLEQRNPLAFGHFANHPGKEMVPNVMICPYDFPLTEENMRTYIPNVMFANEEATMKRFGTFWFKSGRTRNNGSEIPVLKTLVLVTTRALFDEEVLINYRLSIGKSRPSWYTSVDEEEDKRRWS